MKKISLIATLLLAFLLFQECKKDTVTETALTNQTLTAVINDTSWNGDTIRASITYTAATRSKLFTCTGIADNKEVTFSLVAPNTPSTPGFPITTFNLNATTNLTMAYLTAEKNSSGVNVFYPQGTVALGSGTITVTAVDSVKKLITGTFSFTSSSNNYDSNGNITSVNVNEVEGGGFNSMPYTFISN